ncbi:unnamed protein product, partial [Phaeothamnion confervicola]
GTLLLGAGGNELRVWDLLAGGRLLHTVSNHQKTVTCLALDTARARVLSGGLDRHVKIYSLRTYQVTHGLKFHAPLLSLALSPDSSLLAAGTTDGALTVRRRALADLDDDDASSFSGRVASGAADGSAGAAAATGRRGGGIRTGTQRYFDRGKDARPGADDAVVAVTRHKALSAHDKALRKFNYREAMDLALLSRNPNVVVTVLEELSARRGLRIALAGRDEESLEPLLAFLARYVAHPRYAPVLVDVAGTVLDLYSSAIGESETVDELFANLGRQVAAEVRCQKDMRRLAGTLDALMGA